MTAPAPPASAPGPQRPVRARSPWALSWSGVRLVAGLEVRRLLRSRAWLVALVVWAVVVTGVTLLLLGSVGTAGGDALADSGLWVFALIAFAVLALGGLVAPALSATSINGERRDGTLATWQATLLSPAEIATGKLAAGWLASAALVLAATPSILFSYGVAPDMGAGRVVTTLLIVTLSLMTVVAIGLAMSALVQGPITSTVLTYLAVVALGFGGPVLFGLTAALVTVETTVTDRVATSYDAETGQPQGCEDRTRPERQARTDLTWGLLAGSPFVILADAAPRTRDASLDDSDVLRGLSSAVREARLGPDRVGWDDCDPDTAALADEERRASLPPVWGWGVLWLVALTVASWVVAVRRLRVPVRRLPTGMRIA